MAPSKELVYRFHKELNQPFNNPRELIIKALRLLCGYLKLDGACLFSADRTGSLLSLELAWRNGTCSEEEEYIAIREESEERCLLEAGRPFCSSARGIHGLFMPFRRAAAAGAACGSAMAKASCSAAFSPPAVLKADSDTAPSAQGADSYFPGSEAAGAGPEAAGNKAGCGVIRLERGCAAPVGSPGRGRPFSASEKKLAAELIGELAQNLHQTELAQTGREQIRRMTAVTELTGIFASSLRVEDGLRLILQGIQQHFGFDRVRLYLVDKQANKLKGEMSADMRGQVRSLSYEEIPLEPGAHRFADILLGRDSENFMNRYRDSVLYLPLTVQGVPTGLLIVDNLLSQQAMVADDLLLLKSFAGQIALAVDNARLFDEVQELSLYDELTRLPLRRYFIQRLQEETYRAERFKQPMALIWMDVDYFKEVNDTYGHQIGDKVLREVSRVVLGNLRKIDFPCRYGGDEILILLPQSKADDAKRTAVRLRDEVREIRVPVPFAKIGEVRASISQGIAVFPDDASSMEDFLQKADEALYWVKSNGKGEVAVYSEVPELNHPK
ncbi:MAG: sensor domain-containing diguanylate cyclase [bacterium]